MNVKFRWQNLWIGLFYEDEETAPGVWLRTCYLNLVPVILILNIIFTTQPTRNIASADIRSAFTFRTADR